MSTETTRRKAWLMDQRVKLTFGIDPNQHTTVSHIKIGSQRLYTVTIVNVADVQEFVWTSDKARDAYEARRLAWKAFMRKLVKQSKPE